MFNSLSQTLLKMTSPGVPDFYQGSEIWNFTLVDPDNRHPVDFEFRKKMLEALKQKIALYGSDRKGLAKEVMSEWSDGSIKLYVIFTSMKYRKHHRELFTNGDYIALASDGTFNKNVCAFARQKQGKTVLIIAPRFLARLIQVDEDPLGEKAWGDSSILLPVEITNGKFWNLFTGETLAVSQHDGEKHLPLSQIFANFPVAMLEAI